MPEQDKEQFETEKEQSMPESREAIPEQEKYFERHTEKPEEKPPAQQAPAVSDDDNIEAEKAADKLRDARACGRKIEQLVSLANEKGVDFAIAVAKKTNDPALLDLLHDKIIEKGLHKELK